MFRFFCGSIKKSENSPLSIAYLARESDFPRERRKICRRGESFGNEFAIQEARERTAVVNQPEVVSLGHEQIEGRETP